MDYILFWLNKVSEFAIRMSEFLITSTSLSGAVLFVILAMFVKVAYAAQKRDDFDWSNMLRDDSGKESALRLGILVALMVSSWIVIRMAIDGKLDIEYFALFLLIWAGTKTVDRLVDLGVHYFAQRRGISPPPSHHPELKKTSEKSDAEQS